MLQARLCSRGACLSWRILHAPHRPPPFSPFSEAPSPSHLHYHPIPALSSSHQLCQCLSKDKERRVNWVWEGSCPALEVPSDKQGTEQGVLQKGHFREEEIHAVLHTRTLPLGPWHKCCSNPAAQLEMPTKAIFSAKETIEI